MLTIEFEKSVNSVNWREFETAYGSAENIGSELIRLASSNRSEAMEASHLLWCSLCHQHAYISSAAVPAYPFLKKVLESADDGLRVELLDIFAGFAVCAFYKGSEAREPFEFEMQALIQKDIEFFQQQRKLEGPEGYAELLLESAGVEV